MAQAGAGAHGHQAPSPDKEGPPASHGARPVLHPAAGDQVADATTEVTAGRLQAVQRAAATQDVDEALEHHRQAGGDVLQAAQDPAGPGLQQFGSAILPAQEQPVAAQIRQALETVEARALPQHAQALVQDLQGIVVLGHGGHQSGTQDQHLAVEVGSLPDGASCRINHLQAAAAIKDQHATCEGDGREPLLQAPVQAARVQVPGPDLLRGGEDHLATVQAELLHCCDLGQTEAHFP